MEESLFRSIVDEISKHPVDLIQPFLMNDPLMDQNILDRLEYIVRKNPASRVNITTNGLLMDNAFSQELVKLNIDSIHISSNGLSHDTYKKTMGLDSYTVFKNVNYLWDLICQGDYKTSLHVTAIFLKSTKKEIFLAQKYWQSRGIEFFMNPLNDRAGNIESESFKEMLPFSTKTNQEHILSYKMSGCPSIYSFMGILYNGDLVTCCMDWNRAVILGNAKEKSLYDIWHDEPYSAIRRLSENGLLDEVELCKNCSENRFSMDEKALKSLFKKKTGQPDCQEDTEIARQFIKAKENDPDMMKLNIVRE